MTAAESAMSLVDGAIDVISEARASLGGLVSRVEFRGQQLPTSLENIEAAKSSIMDVDPAAKHSQPAFIPALARAAAPPHSQANQPQPAIQHENTSSRAR